MYKLSGEAAEAGLAKAWETILQQDPAGQEIIHVLPSPEVEPAWISDSPVYQQWLKQGREPSDEIWRAFGETARSWPYIVDARRAAARGIPNTRIFYLPPQINLPDIPPWVQYLATIHLPGIAVLAGETHYKVDRRIFQREESDLTPRDYDVNIFGAAGVMLAGETNGNVDWRAFIDETSDPERYRAEREHVLAVRDFVVEKCGRGRIPDVRLLGAEDPRALWFPVHHERPGPGDDLVPGARP